MFGRGAEGINAGLGDEVKVKSEFHALTVQRLAELIATGSVSAREVVETHLERIEAVNVPLNALVVPLFEQALREATAADERRARGEALGPLHGVPITVKESFDLTNTPTTVGLTSRIEHRALRDAAVVASLRRAGAIVLGKTNVSQLLLSTETDNPVYGRSNNPWNTERSTSGSSGGEAAIIAAGGSMLGLGSDIGGSVRLPAHACGVCSLKPTSGRLSMVGHSVWTCRPGAIADQPGPIARHISDLQLAMQVLCADASATSLPYDDPTNVATNDLRVAFYTTNRLFEPAPALRRAVVEAAGVLANHGATVEEWIPPDPEHAWNLCIKSHAADTFAQALQCLGKSKRDWRINRLSRVYALPKGIRCAFSGLFKVFGQRDLARVFREARPFSVAANDQLLKDRVKYKGTVTASMDAGSYDIILSPPEALPAVLHGRSIYLADAASYTGIYNMLGMPAGVVPVTRVRPGEESDRRPGLNLRDRTAVKVERGSAGLPVGVQVAGRDWSEHIVLAAMNVLQTHFQSQPDYPEAPPL